MSFLDSELEAQLKDLGVEGIAKIQEILGDKAADADEEWQRVIYKMVSLSVGKVGPIGINQALDALQSLANGKDADLDWADLDLEVSSDILARLQTLDAAKQSANRAFLVKVGETLKEIIKIVLKIAI